MFASSRLFSEKTILSTQILEQTSNLLKATESLRHGPLSMLEPAVMSPQMRNQISNIREATRPLTEASHLAIEPIVILPRMNNQISGIWEATESLRDGSLLMFDRTAMFPQIHDSVSGMLGITDTLRNGLFLTRDTTFISTQITNQTSSLLRATESLRHVSRSAVEQVALSNQIFERIINSFKYVDTKKEKQLHHAELVNQIEDLESVIKQTEGERLDGEVAEGPLEVLKKAYKVLNPNIIKGVIVKALIFLWGMVNICSNIEWIDEKLKLDIIEKLTQLIIDLYMEIYDDDK